MVWHDCLLTTNDEHLFTGEAWGLCGGKRSDGWQLPDRGLCVAPGCCRTGNRSRKLIAGRLPTEWASEVQFTERTKRYEEGGLEALSQTVFFLLILKGLSKCFTSSYEFAVLTITIAFFVLYNICLACFSPQKVISKFSRLILSLDLYHFPLKRMTE